jgi:hypothetical protein
MKLIKHYNNIYQNKKNNTFFKNIYIIININQIKTVDTNIIKNSKKINEKQINATSFLHYKF